MQNNHNPYGAPPSGTPPQPTYNPEQQYLPQYQGNFGQPYVPQPYMPEPAPYAPASYSAQQYPALPPQAGYGQYPAQPYTQDWQQPPPGTMPYMPEPSPYTQPVSQYDPYARQYGAQPQYPAQPVYGQQNYLPQSSDPMAQPYIPQPVAGQYVQQPGQNPYAPQGAQPQPPYGNGQQPGASQEAGFSVADFQPQEEQNQNNIANQISQMNAAIKNPPPVQGDGFGVSNSADMGAFEDLASRFFGGAGQPQAQNAAPQPATRPEPPPYAAPAGSYGAVAQQLPMNAPANPIPEPQKPAGYDANNEIEKIGSALETALVRSDNERVFTANNLFAGNNDKYMGVDSATSGYNLPDTDIPLFENLSFALPSASCTAVISENPATRYALLYSMGTGRGLSEGSVSIAGAPIDERRDIASQVLYIDGTDMIPGKMTAMEFMMQCAYRVADWPASKQQRFLSMLDELGLSSNAMMTLDNMSQARKVLYLLLATTLNSLIRCIIVNIKKLSVDKEDEIRFRKVFEILNDNGVAVAINDMNPELTASLANRIVAVKGGTLAYAGSFRGFVERYCKQVMLFDMVPDDMLRELASGFPTLSFKTNTRKATSAASGNFDEQSVMEALVTKLAGLGVDPGSIRMSERSFAAAREELMRR